MIWRSHSRQQTSRGSARPPTKWRRVLLLGLRRDNWIGVWGPQVQTMNCTWLLYVPHPSYLHVSSITTMWDVFLHHQNIPGFRNVNVYCSIDNSVGEVNPVTATLNIYQGEVACYLVSVSLLLSQHLLPVLNADWSLKDAPIRSGLINTTNMW